MLINSTFLILFFSSFLSSFDDQIRRRCEIIYNPPVWITSRHSCYPAVDKFVFQSDANFIMEWPAVEISGSISMVTQFKAQHIRSCVLRAINQTDALRRISCDRCPPVVGWVIGSRKSRRYSLCLKLWVGYLFLEYPNLGVQFPL